MKKSPPKRYADLQQGLSPRAQQRIAERAGHTILQVHALWEKGRKGDADADQKLRSLLDKHPEVSKLIDRFLEGASRLNSHNGAHKALTKAVIFKKPESIWSRAKPKWLSVGSGGLPTLGKRR